MVTRFKNATWQENIRWKQRNDYMGCIYNSPVYIKDTIPLMSTIYIIEMNNDDNKILGIGKIVNKVYTDRKCRIYEDGNYNRFTYRGKKHLSRDSIIDISIIEKLEKRLFKGKSHLKRGQGITLTPPDIPNEYLQYIMNLFSS